MCRLRNLSQGFGDFGDGHDAFACVGGLAGIGRSKWFLGGRRRE